MKNQIRKLVKEKRNSMSLEDAQKKSTLAQEVFLSSELYINSNTLMLYMPLGNETDTTIIMNKAFVDSKRVVLPVTDMENVDIIPYIVSPDTDFSMGSYSITEPQNGILTECSGIDTVIVPGIAFDLNGGRIGFGKGYYDRFLSEFKGIRVGLCYDFQLADNVYPESHDVMMNYVITNNGIYKCK